MVGITLGFALTSWDSDPGGETFLGRMANRIAMYLFAVPIMFAILSVVAGIALLGYKTFLWLRYGKWNGFSLGDVLWVIEVKIPYTRWIGLDQTVDELLRWSGIASLIVLIPLVTAMLLAFVIWLLYRAMNVFR